MAEEKLLPPDALQKNVPRIVGADGADVQQRPVPPLAGFWFRLGALLLDIFILRAAVQLTLPVLRPVYLQLGLASVVFELVLIFLYFFLAEGSVGKGKTPGKAILGIRTTDRTGEPIVPRAAAIRAGVLLLVAFCFLPDSIDAEILIGSGLSALFVFRVAFRAALIAYIIANVFLTVLDPLKMTVHDRAAGTLVVRESGEHNLRTYLEQVRESGGPLAKRALQVSAVAFLALGAVQVWVEYKKVFSEDPKRFNQFFREFNNEFGRGSFRVLFNAAFFDSVKNETTRSAVSATSLTIRTRSLEVTGDEPTTDSHLVVFLYRSHLRVKSDDYWTSEELRNLMTDAAAWCEQRLVKGEFPLDREHREFTTRGKDGSATRTLYFQPRYVALLFREEVNLILVPRGQPRLCRAEVISLNLPEGFYGEEPKAAGEKAPRAPRQPDQSRAASGADGATSAPAVLPPRGDAITSPSNVRDRGG